MDPRDRLLGLLERALRAEQEFVDRLTEEQRSASGTLEEWSPKDLIAHCAAWKELMTRHAEAAIARAPEPGLDSVDRINHDIWHKYQDWPWSDVLAYASRSYAALAALVRRVPEETLRATDLFSWSRGLPLWRLIVGNGYLHPTSHLAGWYVAHGLAERAEPIEEEMRRELPLLDGSPEWLAAIGYNLACFHAQSGQTSRALAELREVFQMRPELREWARTDPDLACLRTNPEFVALYGL